MNMVTQHLSCSEQTPRLLGIKACSGWEGGENVDLAARLLRSS